ncbi:hypothetical protein KQI65_00500 [bacterium]|nr:hypothetical protein [bacterium]
MKNLPPIYNITDDILDLGDYDLIAIDGPPGKHPVIVYKRLLRQLAQSLYGVHGHNVHVSSDTALGKTAVLEALLVPETAKVIMKAFSLPVREVRSFSYPVAAVESAAEWYRTLQLKGGETTYVYSPLFSWLAELEDELERDPEAAIVPVCWLLEMGRAISPSIQSGLLGIITRGIIQHPDGREFCHVGRATRFVSDSNYLGLEGQGRSRGGGPMESFQMCAPDRSLFRRFPVVVRPRPFQLEEETAILMHLLHWEGIRDYDEALLHTVVRISHRVREFQRSGVFLSANPGIAICMEMLRMSLERGRDDDLITDDLLTTTLLGNCSEEEQREHIPVLLEQVTGSKRGKLSRLSALENML